MHSSNNYNLYLKRNENFLDKLNRKHPIIHTPHQTPQSTKFLNKSGKKQKAEQKF